MLKTLVIYVPNGLLQIFDTSTTNLGHTQTEKGVNVCISRGRERIAPEVLPLFRYILSFSTQEYSAC